MAANCMIGVAVRDVGPSELSSELALHQADNVCYFVENSVRPIIALKRPCMNIVDAFSFRGKMLATNLSTATKMLNMPCVGGRYFYVWNPEWLNKQVEYSSLWPYYSPRIKLIARCEDYRKIIKNCFNVDVDVITSLEDVFKFMNSENDKSYNTYTLNEAEQNR